MYRGSKEAGRGIHSTYHSPFISFLYEIYKSIGVDETPSCSQGEFSSGLPNGRGEFFYGNGEKALDKYVGDFVDGAVSEN